MNVVPYETVSDFCAAPVRHGFFGRRGGVSDGLYAALNCGMGTADVPANVAANRAAACTALGVAAESLATLYQVHGTDCHIVTDVWPAGDRPKGDAMVTDVPGLALGILTADCAPVLFYGLKADGAPVIGAAHAGWGGALKGVIESTLAALVALGAERQSLAAAIGPCIAVQSYEVAVDFAAPFIAQDEANSAFFHPGHRTGRLMFDLPGYIASRLRVAGVQRVAATAQDTYAAEGNYFSYRRACHRGEDDYGRQLAVICIRP